jgi:Fic family protein
MKIPQSPPPFDVAALMQQQQLARVVGLAKNPLVSRHYLHWERLRFHKVPGYSVEELWMAAKLQRLGIVKPIPLCDKREKPFVFCVPELVQEGIHKIDMGAGAAVGVPEPITNPHTKDKYLVRSLMEEAITSSQLEGAATTREVAKEMIRTGRTPRDRDERMILNNYVTMQRISALKDKPLSREMVFEIHALVTNQTFPVEFEDAAGRFRTDEEKRIVGDDYGVVFHDPPLAGQLEERMKAMCDFANGITPDYFIHPVVRAIILHFWLAYDHPFVDGNGRTARALFYWAMLHGGYWLFEFISVSTILRKAPVRYGRSFLYTETDDNDLTYFIIEQTYVIERAIKELHDYIDRKSAELRELESQLRALDLFNHRQVDLVRHALKNPFAHFTIESHKSSHKVVYETARTDLLDLQSRGVLIVLKKKGYGKSVIFSPVKDLVGRLRKLGKKI